MKILYFYQYFSTPKGSWGTRVYEFTKKWVEAGHDVTVVSSIYAKSDLKAKRFIETQVFEGVKVKVVNIKIDNKQPIFKRIWSFIVYMGVACFYALTYKTDVAIASSGPLTAGIPGLLAKFRGRKFVFEVRDLWPDTAISMGLIKNKRAQKMMYKLEATCYKNSDLIVALSKGMKDNILSRFGERNIVDVPNAANLDLFQTKTPKNQLPEVFIKKKVAIYTGNIGEVNNSFLLLNAARILQKKNSRIVILMIGQGQQKQEIETIIKQERLSTIQVMDLIPKTTLVSFLQNSMVSLVPLSPNPVLDTSSPNKLFESLAAGLPVIQTTQGWLKQLLESNQCGYTVSASNPFELANLLLNLSNGKENLVELSTNAVYTAKLFDKDLLANKMLDAIEKL